MLDSIVEGVEEFASDRERDDCEKLFSGHPEYLNKHLNIGGVTSCKVILMGDRKNLGDNTNPFEWENGSAEVSIAGQSHTIRWYDFGNSVDIPENLQV